MRNINSIITSHNKSRNKELSPIKYHCLTPMTIYEAIVVNNYNIKNLVYFGVSDTTFKERYCNHTQNSLELNGKLLTWHYKSVL